MSKPVDGKRAQAESIITNAIGLSRFRYAGACWLFVDNVMIRDLLFGHDCEASESYHGIWGICRGHDDMSPHIFRVSSTSVYLLTTFQWWSSQAVALQGSVLGGVGYAAAGNVAQVGPCDYHYGFTPQGLLALRLVFSEKAILDLTERAYYLSGVGGDDPGGNETIERLNMGLTVGVYGRHALGIPYIASIRDAHYFDRVDFPQTIESMSFVYTWLVTPGSAPSSGAVPTAADAGLF